MKKIKDEVLEEILNLFRKSLKEALESVVDTKKIPIYEDRNREIDGDNFIGGYNQARQEMINRINKIII